MMDTKIKFSILHVIVLVLALGLAYAYQQCAVLPDGPNKPIARTLVQRETTYVTSTRFVPRPYPVPVDCVRYIDRRDTLRIVAPPFCLASDTVTTYDSARIASSFNYPEMTFTHFYQGAPKVTLRDTIYQTTTKRWGLGFGAGYGITSIGGQPSAGAWAGIAITCNIIQW